MNDADIISHVRNLRKLVVTLDAIGFPAYEIECDNEFNKYAPSNLSEGILKLSSKIHKLIQNIEKSKRYKEATKKMCRVKEDYNG